MVTATHPIAAADTVVTIVLPVGRVSLRQTLLLVPKEQRVQTAESDLMSAIWARQVSLVRPLTVVIPNVVAAMHTAIA